MRLLWEIFTLCLAVGLLFALGRGFPAFGAVLRAVLFHPLGWVCLAGLVIYVIVRRHRASARQAANEER